MPRAVLFDFNGVLVDDEPIHLRLLLQVLAEEGVEADAGWAAEAFLGVDDRGCLERAFAHAGRELAPELLSRLVARKAAYYQQEVRRDGYPLAAGAERALAELDRAGYRLGIVTGALRHEVDAALREAGLRDRFQVVVAAQDVARGKPDPAGYLLAIQELNRPTGSADRLIHPHEIVAVEDSPAGLAAAAAAGLRTIRVGDAGEPESSAAPAIRVEALAELTPERLETLLSRV